MSPSAVTENIDKFLLLFISLITIVYLFIISFVNLRKSPPGPPGPFGLPILGYLPFLDASKPYVTLTNLSKKYGKIYSIQLGSVNTVVISDAKLIKEALSQDNLNGRAPLYLTHGIMDGKGIICAQGELWKFHRRFVSKNLKDLGVRSVGPERDFLEGKILKHVNNFVQDLNGNLGIRIDSGNLLRHYTGSVIMDLTLGQTMEKTDTTWLYLQTLLDEGFKAVTVAGPLNFLPWLRFFPKYKSLINWIMDGKKKSHQVYQEMWDMEKEKLSADPNHKIESIAGAYISEMEKRSNEETEIFNMNQIHHTIADIMGAGWDTVLTSLKWLLLYMALYPDIQIKVREEIDKEVGRNSSPKLSDFKNLPYTESVVIGNYLIPKGAMVVPNLWAIHHDPEIWKNPEDFNPERHLTDNGLLKKSENLLPFQTGKRICLGENLGRWIVFLFFSNILQKFQMTLPDNANTQELKEHLGECGVTLVPQKYELIFSKSTLVL